MRKRDSRADTNNDDSDALLLTNAFSHHPAIGPHPGSHCEMMLFPYESPWAGVDESIAQRAEAKRNLVLLI